MVSFDLTPNSEIGNDQDNNDRPQWWHILDIECKGVLSIGV